MSSKRASYAERFGSGGGGGGSGGPRRSLASEAAAGRHPSGGPRGSAGVSSGSRAAFANSAGTSRLNRILHQNPASRPSYVPGSRGGRGGAGRGGAGGYGSRGARSLAATRKTDAANPAAAGGNDADDAAGERIGDPTDEGAVGDWVAALTQRLRVDPRSIGGQLLQAASRQQQEEPRATSNLLASSGKGGSSPTRSKSRADAAAKSQHAELVSSLRNECLFAARVAKFDLAGGQPQPKHNRKHIPKSRNKLRYVCLVRTTNRRLRMMQQAAAAKSDGVEGIHNEDENGSVGGGGAGGDDHSDAASEASSAGYDQMFSPNDDGPTSKSTNKARGGKVGSKSSKGTSSKGGRKAGQGRSGDTGNDDDDDDVAPEDEISSFPALVCMALHSDGTNPDIRRVLMLDQLLGVESVLPQPGEAAGSSTSVVLVFRTGDRVEIECGDGPASAVEVGPDAAPGAEKAGGMRREKFLWNLLQLHAILCTAVVERYGAAMVRGGSRARAAASSLPPLKTRNVDRAELQYASTANGFLGASPALVALLDRQRNRGGEGRGRGGDEEKTGEDGDGSDDKGTGEEMDGLAYDMLMGNYNTRMALFVSEEEKQDAEEVLNSTQWYQHGEEKTGDDGTAARHPDAAASAEALAQILQKKMRDLEAETCRRLIAWEDEKHYSITGSAPDHAQRDTVDALSLAALFNTLDLLDGELGDMEEWLQGRAKVIKPLTDDCAGIEEENRQEERKLESYGALGQELRRLLAGLDVPPALRKTLSNPTGALQYDSAGNVDAKTSERGIDEIYQAGRFLKDAIDRVEKEGGVHLRAVSERVEKLASVANQFCMSLAQIVVTVMEQLSSDVVATTDFTKSSKSESHTTVAKRIRDAQRKFQSSLLGYIKLIEVLALLKPSLLPAIRDAYSELVAEGILSKKRMKVYFASLPQRSSVSGSNVTKDLKEYSAVTLRGNKEDTSSMPVNSQDIQKALSEILPVVAREAYFTAALFGLSSRHMDGREKKRNFESAKRSVDHSSQYFRYYMSRICGIASEADAEGKRVTADPMLSLVSSIHLNEAMDSYIDRQKKGGDHSLSLAYVRATILDMRKKVDKQWVTWVEEEIKWIKTSSGVPLNGKRAGVFASYSHFPAYLDHVMLCCKADRPKDYSPNLHKIKVVSYYLQKMAGSLFASLHECAERETTDQQYAANVMRMENSYFFTQSIKQRGSEMTTLFQKQITAASAICKQSTDAYLGWMIKREFKSLHSLFSNISRIRRDVGDGDVPIHVPRATFVRTLQKESSREVMKEKISVIYARMEKHLSEQGGLLPVAWKALVKVLYEWFGRWEKLSTQCYKFILEPSAVDVVRIAKAAGGANRAKSLASEAKASTSAGAGAVPGESSTPRRTGSRSNTTGRSAGLSYA